MDISQNKKFGTIAEFRVIVELIARNFVVSIPQGEYAGYDLIADNLAGKLFRLQIKSTNRQIPQSKGFRINIGRGKSQKKPYTLKDCDFLICVIFPVFYIIPIKDIDVVSLNVFPNGNSGLKAPVNYRGNRWEIYKNKWDLIF
jgi:hypothetical protein